MSTDPDSRPLVHAGGTRRFFGVFLGAYTFYLLLGDPFDPLDLVTGTVTALWSTPRSGRGCSHTGRPQAGRYHGSGARRCSMRCSLATTDG